MNGVVIKPLSIVPELIPALQTWFEAEWPEYYGRGGRGSASRDLMAYCNVGCNVGSLPVGMVAFRQGQPSLRVLPTLDAAKDAGAASPHL